MSIAAPVVEQSPLGTLTVRGPGAASGTVPARGLGAAQAKPGAQPLPGRCLVIVPVFNERDSVGKLVRRLRRALPAYCDVLVIDDGSSDDTVGQVPPGTPVVPLPFNLGIGGAMQTGYRYAAEHAYDLAVQVDGDGQHRPGDVWRLIQHLRRSHVDMVVGSRFLEPNRQYHQTLVRRVGSVFLRGLIRALTGLRITDCTSGFRAANRRVIRAFAHWYPEDYPEPEVILLLHRAGFIIDELAVRMRQRRAGKSSIGLVSGVFYVLKVTACLLLDLVRRPWPETAAPPAASASVSASARSRSSPAAMASLVSAASSEQGEAGHDSQATDPAVHWGRTAAAGRAPTESVQA